ncbi:hypothetical protein SAMN04487918_1011863 [Bacillus sp. bc15]|nr:hypothetical protein SAMN04487918_1011863 [Bacillus sp. bc15]
MCFTKQPGKKRGIERRAAYEREKPCDPLLMQRYVRSIEMPVHEWDSETKESVISEILFKIILVIRYSIFEYISVQTQKFFLCLLCI